MPKATWGEDPEFFGPRHAHREGRLLRALERADPDGRGLHLECAAGVGSFTITLARRGRRVIAADASLRSLTVVAHRARALRLEGAAAMVVADVTRLPFRDSVFRTASTAETLEHIEAHERAVAELARVIRPSGVLVGTVPAGPSQWSKWDVWAGHVRRYTAGEMRSLLGQAGWDAYVRSWGWPIVRLYDDFFLRRVNSRRLEAAGTVTDDSRLRAVASLGRRRALVKAVRALFALDRPFDGVPWGVGLVFSATRRGAPRNPDRNSAV